MVWYSPTQWQKKYATNELDEIKIDATGSILLRDEITENKRFFLGTGDTLL